MTVGVRNGLLLLVVACLSLTGACASMTHRDVFTIHVAPSGDDRNNGLARDTAVLSLDRAHEILMAANPGQDVEIRIAAGTYHDQHVKWTFTMPENSITFLPLDNNKMRPVFDGCPAPDAEPSQCEGGTWFILTAADGAQTNLHFEGLHVKRYQTAISFDGNRNRRSASNGANSVEGSYFEDIGNGFNTSLEPSTAAIRFRNSKSNVISDNHFVNIENIGRGSRLIHALYLAHHSRDNRIVGNRFVNISGDAVRLRDASDNNEISKNRFSKAGRYGYSDWYCDQEARDDCTKRAPECPSWNNSFSENVLDGTLQCAPMPEYFFYQDEVAAGCAPPSETAERLYTSGNKSTSKVCSLQ